MPSDSKTLPARIIPPAVQPPLLRYLRTVVRNPLEVWPEAIYRDGIHVERFLGRDAVFVMDPDLIHRMLVEEPEKYIKSEMMQRLLAPALGTGMVTSDGAQWRRQRGIVAPLFRPAEVARYVPQMLAAADREAVRLAAIPDGAPVSLSFEMMQTTFDVVAETMLAGGDAFDVAALAEAIDVYLASAGWVVALAQLRLPASFPWPGRRRFLGARDYLRRVTGDLVAARRRGRSRPDLIQALIDARDEATGEAMTDVEIVDNLLTFIAAGHETTALALSWSFYLLSLNPAVERKVLAEAEAAGAPDRLTPEGVAGLGYTRQVISEALRLYPAAPALLRQPVVPVELGGVKVKTGTQIFIPIYAVHRHRALWDDPDSFDPDRFAPEAGRMRHRYQYIPFGGGPRICIGMGFALTEAAAIMAKLLPRFRFEVTAEPVPVAQVTLRPRNGLSAILRHRQKAAAARAA